MKLQPPPLNHKVPLDWSLPTRGKYFVSWVIRDSPSSSGSREDNDDTVHPRSLLTRKKERHKLYCFLPVLCTVYFETLLTLAHDALGK
jgi:hypothetical protein